MRHRRSAPNGAGAGAPGRAAGALLAIALVGCPGTLDDPERFGSGVCELDVEADIFATSCALATCHDSAAAAAGLDLSGAGAAARLVGVPATTAAEDPTAECEGQGLHIDPADPEASLLLDKVGRSPRCGGSMPFGSMGLSDEQIVCIRQYVVAAAGGPGPVDAGPGGDAGVPMDGGADAGDAGPDGGM